MKRMVSAVVCMFCIVSVTNLFAEKSAQVAGQQKAVISNQRPEVKTIFAYKKELNITDKQEKDLMRVLNDLKTNFANIRKNITTLNADLAKMIREKKNLTSIRAKIDGIARLQADALFADIETSIKVEGILNEGQLTKWKAIQGENKKELLQKADEPRIKEQQKATGGKK